MNSRYSPYHPHALLARLVKASKVRACDRNSDGLNWHSWDPHPWKHPWLTSDNLRAAKAHSVEVLRRERAVLEQYDSKAYRYGFCGNIANTMYMRAVPLRASGERVSVFLNSQDDYIMSHPCWEEYDGVLPDGLTSYRAALAAGVKFPDVGDVWQLPEVSDWAGEYASTPKQFLRPEDVERFSPYLSQLPTLKALQEMDALWATQSVFLAYLANRPYITSQSGGDIWFEASRGDLLGELMRESFRRSRLLVVSNPWTYAHARRYGFTNLIYMPKILDETVYAPGGAAGRDEWSATSGGDFFVLTSSRLDERNKGSSIGLRGFAIFCQHVPSARLVLIGWGKDTEKKSRLLARLGIEEKVIVLPVSGKAKLRDYLRSADVFLDQFVLGYFGSAAMEGMACGLPVIGRVESDQYDSLSETGAPPILNASTPEEVAKHLLDLYQNNLYRSDLAAAHRQWLCENHGAGRWLDDYRAVLTATAVNWPLDLSNTPLLAPISRHERDYYAYGLAVSPSHPHYGW